VVVPFYSNAESTILSIVWLNPITNGSQILLSIMLFPSHYMYSSDVLTLEVYEVVKLKK